MSVSSLLTLISTVSIRKYDWSYIGKPKFDDQQWSIYLGITLTYQKKKKKKKTYLGITPDHLIHRAKLNNTKKI